MVEHHRRGEHPPDLAAGTGLGQAAAGSLLRPRAPNARALRARARAPDRPEPARPRRAAGAPAEADRPPRRCYSPGVTRMRSNGAFVIVDEGPVRPLTVGYAGRPRRRRSLAARRATVP